MTSQLPPQDFLSLLHATLQSAGYNSAALQKRLGQSIPPGPDTEDAMMQATAVVNRENLLVRLFLLGNDVPEDLCHEFLPAELLSELHEQGFLATDAGHTYADVVIIPIDNLLFVSDAFRVLGTSAASEFVLPASTHSANFLKRFTLRDPVRSTLDLGCGCGIHALFAARHSERVVATDISDRAVYYTGLNAALNGIDNVEVRQGDLFEPVSGETFDRIVCNPPFVLAPGTTFVYRDNTMVLDQFCRLLARRAPEHLHDAGILQMLCEWVEVEDEPWRERLADWFIGCDAWVLHPQPISTAQYVASRNSDISDTAVAATSTAEWQQYFDAHKVQRIHPGLITLRKRAGDNWQYFRDANEAIDEANEETIVSGLQAFDFLGVCDDDSLAEAYLVPRDNRSSTLQLDDNVEAYLALFDGTQSVAQCVAEFMTGSGDTSEQLRADLLSMTRTLVVNGFLTPLAD